MKFSSLESLAAHLSTHAIAAYKEQLHQELSDVGRAVETRVHEKLGVYQPAIAQFDAWAPLADSTIAKKQRMQWGKNGNPDSPLYATGDLDRSVEHTVLKQKLAVAIGTNKGIAAILENGSIARNLPPRPIFGPAAYEVLPPRLPRIQQLVSQGLGGTGGFGILLS